MAEKKDNCPDPHGDDFDFGAPPVLQSLGGGGLDILLLSQKSGVVYAVDPGHCGRQAIRRFPSMTWTVVLLAIAEQVEAWNVPSPEARDSRAFPERSLRCSLGFMFLRRYRRYRK
jgi:hypothetical protein